MYVLIFECAYKNQTILLEFLAGSFDATTPKDHFDYSAIKQANEYSGCV